MKDHRPRPFPVENAHCPRCDRPLVYYPAEGRLACPEANCRGVRPTNLELAAVRAGR